MKDIKPFVNHFRIFPFSTITSNWWLILFTSNEEMSTDEKRNFFDRSFPYHYTFYSLYWKNWQLIINENELGTENIHWIAENENDALDNFNNKKIMIDLDQQQLCEHYSNFSPQLEKVFFHFNVGCHISFFSDFKWLSHSFEKLFKKEFFCKKDDENFFHSNVSIEDLLSLIS